MEKTFTEEEVIYFLRKITLDVRENGYGFHSTNASYVLDWWAQNEIMGAVQVNAVYRVTDDAIYGFFREHRDLSNFGEFPIEWEGLVYPSTEAAFQASKTLDPKVREFFTTLSPSEAKKKGRLITLRPDWEEEKDWIMYQINKIKYTQHDDAKKLLLSTKGKYLEETNWWNDTYWGVCKGKGHNRLGTILMLIRAELLHEHTVVRSKETLKAFLSMPDKLKEEKNEVDNVSGSGENGQSGRSSTPE